MFSNHSHRMFQHTAARRRLGCDAIHSIKCVLFQHTAARRRLVLLGLGVTLVSYVSTHSRPKAAGLYLYPNHAVSQVSTHSRPKAAGRSKAKRSGTFPFQHTAARRRLGLFYGRSYERFSFNTQPPEGGWGRRLPCRRLHNVSFNTQPPEGGWRTQPQS